MTHQLELATLKRDWLDRTVPQVIALAKRLNELTSDDLHEHITDKPWHFNWYGIVFAVLKNSGHLQRVGYRPSKRPEANGRVVAVWRAVWTLNSVNL